MGAAGSLFDAGDLRHKTFSRQPGGSVPAAPRMMMHPASYALPELPALRQPGHGALHRDAERVLLKYAPPGVVVSAGLEIVQFQGDTSPFLTPPSGVASYHLLKMLREDLAGGVREALQRAEAQSAPVRAEGLRVRSNGGFLTLAVEAIPIRASAGGSGGFVVLFDAGGKSAPAAGVASRIGAWWKKIRPRGKGEMPSERDEEMAHLTHELAATRETLQAVSEQHEAVAEELRSASEEAQSASEEMQSVNEELETSKEEMQATNEELATLNEELAQRNGELNGLAQDLSASEARFRAAVGAVSSLIWTNNAAGLMAGEQPGWGGFTGQSQAEYQGYGWATAVHPEDAQPTIDAWDRAVAETRMFVFEHRLRRRDGAWRLCSIRAVPAFDDDGTIREWVGVHTDITEERQAQKALGEREALFSTIIEQAPGGVYVIDDEFRVVEINALARPTFAAAEPVIGRDFAEVMRILWGPELGVDLAAIFRHTLQTGERYISPPFTAPRGDLGIEQSYDWETHPIHLPSGRQGVVCYFTDVTAQRTLEAALRASEQRATDIVQSIDDGFITLDLEWRMTFLSTRGAEILAPLQTSADDVLGKIFWEEFPATVGTVFEENYRRAMREQVPVKFEAHYAPLNRWFDVRAYPSPSGLSIYFLDSTERKQAEDALRLSELALAEQAEELRAADRSKNEFLAMLAHELRNPLAPLRNASELLQAADVTSVERNDAQQIIARQIENMSRMIDDLLDVSRITEGKINLKKKPVSLETILTAAASLARSGCAAHGQELTVSLPTEPVFLDADATRLEQVFGNLLTNACKYSGDGCHIVLSAEVVAAVESSSSSSSSSKSGGRGIKDEDEDDYEHEGRREVLVRVTDDGAGIDPELLPHVFGLFVQASRTLDRAHGGLGIGLTVVQRLVRLHGGSIEARSDGLGHGAEFIVRLPILAAAPPAPAPPPPPAQETPRRILIVDDNTDSARSLATLQKRRGHETHTAFTGPEAVAAAAEFLPEVVLLDIGLPGMDGFEVARRLRAMPALRGVLIIAMSGYGRDEDRAEAKQAGFDEYLVKPVDLEQLRTWLREIAGPVDD